MLIYFYYKEHQNIQVCRCHYLYVILADQIVNLTKSFTQHIAIPKSNFFKMKHI